jgi:hypothetical protein
MKKPSVLTEGFSTYCELRPIFFYFPRLNVSSDVEPEPSLDLLR